MGSSPFTAPLGVSSGGRPQKNVTTAHAQEVKNRTSIFDTRGSKATTSAIRRNAGGGVSSINRSTSAAHSIYGQGLDTGAGADDKRYTHIRQLIRQNQAEERERIRKK